MTNGAEWCEYCFFRLGAHIQDPDQRRRFIVKWRRNRIRNKNNIRIK